MGCGPSKDNRIAEGNPDALFTELGLSKYNLSAAEKKRIATLVVGNYMFLLADPAQHDCPIVYTSEGFTQFTGYTSAEITGKNCRFLQGKDTTKESVDKVREAMRVKKPTAVSLVNYKKDGTKFYNSFFIAPVYDATNNFVLYLGIQKEIALEQMNDKPLPPNV